MEVPAGTQSGTELRLRGRGVPRLRGAGRGDLHVIVTVVVPPKPSKRERELLKELGEVERAAGPAQGRSRPGRSASRPLQLGRRCAGWS